MAAARAAAAADAAAAEASTAQVYPKKKPGAQKNMLKGARMAFANNPPGALPNKITFSKVWTFIRTHMFRGLLEANSVHLPFFLYWK